MITSCYAINSFSTFLNEFAFCSQNPLVPLVLYKLPAKTAAVGVGDQYRNARNHRPTTGCQNITKLAMAMVNVQSFLNESDLSNLNNNLKRLHGMWWDYVKQEEEAGGTSH